MSDDQAVATIAPAVAFKHESGASWSLDFDGVMSVEYNGKRVAWNALTGGLCAVAQSRALIGVAFATMSYQNHTAGNVCMGFALALIAGTAFGFAGVAIVRAKTAAKFFAVVKSQIGGA
jgi:hypothetical protein